MSARRTKTSGVMDTIIQQGQENVERLSETFREAPVTDVPLDYLIPSRNNPRRRISAASIEEMVNGIQQTGGEILQPLLVRPIPMTPEGARYEIICGNRRYLGAQRLSLTMIPVRVREMDDDTAARFALWENLSREDLSPMDIAEGINDLRKIDRLSWDDIGERFGFTRQWGRKQQQLAELPEEIRELVREGALDPSKAMLIAQEDISEEEAIALARRVVASNLSHRALQAEIRCKHVLPSDDSTGADAKCKHVFTWTPPRGFSKRRHARLTRAAEELVAGINLGTISTEYARSLYPLLEELRRIGGDPPPTEEAKNSEPENSPQA